MLGEIKSGQEMLAKIQQLKPKYDAFIGISGFDYHVITLYFTEVPNPKITEELCTLKTAPQLDIQTKHYLENLRKIIAEEIITLRVKLIYSPPIELAEIIANCLENEYNLHVIRRINHYDFAQRVDKFRIESIQKYHQERKSPVNLELDWERCLKEIAWVRGNILRIGQYAYDLSGCELDFDYTANQKNLAYEGKIDWNYLDENGWVKHGVVITLNKRNKSMWGRENGLMFADLIQGRPQSWQHYWFEQKARVLRKFFNYPEPRD